MKIISMILKISMSMALYICMLLFIKTWVSNEFALVSASMIIWGQRTVCAYLEDMSCKIADKTTHMIIIRMYRV